MTLEVICKKGLSRELIPVKHVKYNEAVEKAVIYFEKDAIIDALDVTQDGGTGYYYIEAKNVKRWDLPDKPTFLQGTVKDDIGKDALFNLHF